MTASITPFKPGSSGSDCLKYYEEQLANGGREDYYLQEEGHAEMYGRGLDRLAPDTEAGADGVREFDRKAMMNMLEGKDNAGNEILKSTYRSLDGKESKGRIPGWDITFSPDKSVSVAWAAASPELRKQIEAAHDSAARGALDHIQNHYGLANEGRGGAERVQADISAGIFRHGASRELEPQLHSHCVIPNMAVKADGKVVSINGGELYRRQKEAGAIYRAELADGMKKLGFDVERKGDNFRLSGVPQGICDQYSTRREQIKDAMDERGTHGAKAAEVAALDTRSAKQGVPDSVLLKQWQGEMAEKGFTAESVEALRGREKAPDSPAATMPSHDEFLQKLTSNNSTFSKNDVWREAAVAAQGVTDRHGAANYAQEFLSTKSPDVLRLQHKENGAIRYTSREMFDLERGMIADASALRDRTTHQIDSSKVDGAIDAFQKRKGFDLSPDQVAAIHAATTGGDFVTIQGWAGAGKSTGAEAAADAWRSQGFRVRGLAMEGIAAEGLAGANIESTTIASAMMKNQGWTDDKGRQRPPADPFTKNDVLLVDEAGKVDSRTMAKLTAAAIDAGAKVVVVGDTKQKQPIGAGGAFNAQQKEYGGADAELTNVQRQKEQWGRDMTTAARNGKATEALGYLHERDALHISDSRAGAFQSTVDKWRENYSHARLGSSCMLANTNADVKTLNDAAREQLKRDGVLGGHGVETEIENREGSSLGKREFLEGDRVVFGRSAKISTGAKVVNGQTGTIESINMDNDGQQHFSIRRDGTGDLVNVPTSEYKALNYGYALTTDKAQGLTADHVSILAGGRMQDLHATYVQLSRMKYSADVSCSKDALEAEMMKHEPTDKMRDYAADLAEKNGVELPEGAKDNFRICRDFMNEYSPQQIKNGKPVDPWQRDISNLTDAMSKERIKETSLDYDLANEGNFVDKSKDNFVDKSEGEFFADKSESEEGSSKDGGQNAGATLPPHKDENDQGESLGSGLVKGVTSALSSQGGENSQIKKDAGKVADSLKTFVNPLSKIPGLGGGLER
jgi:conjugative relaxase-like TrwC/TraI family protein